jgi:succinate-acetate transporter protein
MYLSKEIFIIFCVLLIFIFILLLIEYIYDDVAIGDVVMGFWVGTLATYLSISKSKPK